MDHFHSNRDLILLLYLFNHVPNHYDSIVRTTIADLHIARGWAASFDVSANDRFGGSDVTASFCRTPRREQSHKPDDFSRPSYHFLMSYDHSVSLRTALPLGNVVLVEIEVEEE
jgi:hypothetical protein